MGWWYRTKVNLAIAKLGGDPAHVSTEFRQLMQVVGEQSGNSAQEVALWVLAQMPLSYRMGLDLAPVKGWIRARKINPDDPEIICALRQLGWDSGSVLM